MLSTNNIFSPSSGKPIMTPTQDIALGVYYLTTVSQRDKLADKKRSKNAEEDHQHLPIFNDAMEAHLAYDEGAVHLHTRIRYRNPDLGLATVFGDSESKVIVTTIGRVFFQEIIPAKLGFINRCCDKTFLGKIIWHCYHVSGHVETIQMLDRIKNTGF